MNRYICGRCHARMMVIEPDGYSLCLSCQLTSRPRRGRPVLATPKPKRRAQLPLFVDEAKS